MKLDNNGVTYKEALECIHVDFPDMKYKQLSLEFTT